MSVQWWILWLHESASEVTQTWYDVMFDPQSVSRENKATKWMEDVTRCATETLWQNLSHSLGPGDPFRPGARQDGHRSSGRNRLIVMVFPSLQEVRGKHIYCPEIQHIRSQKQFSKKDLNKQKQNQQDFKYKSSVIRSCKNYYYRWFIQVFYCNTGWSDIKLNIFEKIKASN